MALPAKLRLGLEILAAYGRAWWGMRRHELPTVVARVRAEHAHRSTPLPTAEKRHLAAVTMRLLSVLPTDSRCLARSLTYLSLLEHRGVSGTLVIGVQTQSGFRAHAWVECDGIALLPSGSGEYEPLAKF